MAGKYGATRSLGSIGQRLRKSQQRKTEHCLEIALQAPILTGSGSEVDWRLEILAISEEESTSQRRPPTMAGQLPLAHKK
jgi:hypothetical protein